MRRVEIEPRTRTEFQHLARQAITATHLDQRGNQAGNAGDLVGLGWVRQPAEQCAGMDVERLGKRGIERRKTGHRTVFIQRAQHTRLAALQRQRVESRIEAEDHPVRGQIARPVLDRRKYPRRIRQHPPQRQHQRRSQRLAEAFGLGRLDMQLAQRAARDRTVERLHGAEVVGVEEQGQARRPGSEMEGDAFLRMGSPNFLAAGLRDCRKAAFLPGPAAPAP